MKFIVTHLSPDLDALASCWLIKRFLTGWSPAETIYVPAGETYKNQPPDLDSNVIHVDTGLGRFDHHQANTNNCSASLIFDDLVKKNTLKNLDKEAISRIIKFVNLIDHFHYVNYPNPDDDLYDFTLYQIIESLKPIIRDQKKFEEITFQLFDAELLLFKNKIIAESEIKKGYEFKSSWGKTLVLETANNETINLALKRHFQLVARKDPKKGNIRIKTLPEKELDLTPLYNKIKEIDIKGSWFLHISKNMLLNGSIKNPKHVPSPITTKQLIEIIKSV